MIPFLFHQPQEQPESSWGPSIHRDDDAVTKYKLPFAPLSQTLSYPNVRIADLVSSAKATQEFQLAFKQKQTKSARGANFMQKKRAAIQKRQQQAKQQMTKEQERERKIQMDKMSKMKGQKYRERKRWNYKSPLQNKQLSSSIEIRSSWESKSMFTFAKLQKEEYKKNIRSEILKEAGYVHFYDEKLNAVNTRRAKKLVVPKTPKYSFYSVKTMEDENLQQFAQESESLHTVVITDRIMSLIMSSTRSILSWDIVIVKKDGKIFFDKRNNKQRVDIVAVDETSRDPPSVSDDTNDINSEHALSMEATRINLNFQRFSVKQPEDPQHGPGVLYLDEDETPNPFQKEGQIAAPMAFIYKKFDGAIGTEEDYKLISVRALNEYKTKRPDSWRNLLDGSTGRVITTEIKNNACKFARWVSQATLAGTQEMKIGFVSRVDERKKSPHQLLGVSTYLISTLTQQIGLNKRNMWGIFNSIVNEVSKCDDGKYALIKLPNKQSLQLYRISSTTGGALVLRRHSSGKYQFLLLKSGDNLVAPHTKTEQSEREDKTARRALKRDLGFEESDVVLNNEFRFESQYQDADTCEERTEIMFAAFLKDPNQDINLSENYGDYEWRDWNPPHNVDPEIDDVLAEFASFAKSKGGVDGVFGNM
eukprot:CAMPEP_0117455610 /NCGR_PEP_ID=MMETSP0759-20121206/11453_1 /TAXON_ID=63605 /ORGANISM="Percolomonas cosmopolitus, Strain WS" /LENGTH=646 /DNA_ID=CAMNT_0005248929 /DNA_START=54 /DNA_END=1994 /DNA_ORIENTATION=-